MTSTDQPRLRPVESFPVSQPGGEVAFALRDPEGFAASILLPHAAATLASWMDGTRTYEDLQQAFRRKFSETLELQVIEQLVRDLDARWFLDNPRFRSRWKAEIERYLNSPSRPAAHAGAAYADREDRLRQQLAELFAGEKGPGVPTPATAGPMTARLCGVLSPHIDLHRGGSTFAWAYKRLVEESAADLFVIFGTAHSPMRNLFSVTKKNFQTPLGTVQTDRKFISKLAANLAAMPGAGELNLFADELAHRPEHSIEFQAVFLQYLLGDRRPFTIVPVLTGSFHSFIAGKSSPAESPEVRAFVDAMRKTAADFAGRVCYISSGDLAHIGQRFGDREFLNATRLTDQAEHDRALLEAACRPDADSFFRQIAAEADRHRICGLSPTYTLLKVTQPKRGELLKYDQAVELDGTACVSFASAVFYDD
jgi:AmmeMemoRadiSam system protein B